MMNRLQKFLAIQKLIYRNRLPLIQTEKRVFEESLSRQVSLSLMYQTSYLLHPETFMPMNEYICRAVDLNDLSMKPLVINKINVFTRLKDSMGREVLNVTTAAPADIDAFIEKHGTVVGKTDLSAGRGFRVFSKADGDGHDTVAASGVTILEPYIKQHHVLNAIYPDSVNTLRIHTVRNSEKLRVFLPPKLRIGADGSKTDWVKRGTTYRVLLDDDGSVVQAYKNGPDEPFDITEVHHNTGYRFVSGAKIPFVREAEELCLRSALLIPELRYLAWDIAITEDGPIIVEVNDVSGVWETIQRIHELRTGEGARKIAEDMFDFAFEGARYNDDFVFISEPFAKVGAEYPSLLETFLILIQSAVHRHGVEFFDREFSKRKEPKKIPCRISCERESLRIDIRAGERTVPLDIPDPSSLLDELPAAGQPLTKEQLFALDRSAVRIGAQVYEMLRG